MTSGGRVASFSALSGGSSLAGFPALTQADSGTSVGGGTATLLQKGSLVTSLAGILRYYQNRGTLGAPNGLATPQLLNLYLTTNSGYLASETGDPIANPWSATSFAGLRGGVSVETATQDRLYDLIATGVPVLAGLSVTVGGAPSGMTYVVATGVAADGSVQIADSAFGRGSLNDYIYGFTRGTGKTYQATIGSLLRINPEQQAPAGFVIGTTSRANMNLGGPAGTCGAALNLWDAAVPEIANSGNVGGVRFVSCDGVQAAYQLSVAGGDALGALDFASSTTQAIPATAIKVYGVSRVAGVLTVAPQTVGIAAVVNSASFQPGVTAGGLATIFGSGLVTGGSDVPSVTVAGFPAYVYAAFPFQVNFQIPAGVPVGNSLISITGLLGTTTQNINVSPTAAGIFSIGRNAANQLQAAVVNQDGTVNGPNNPAKRGEYIAIYCTGLGVKVAQGGYQVAQAAVKVVLGGVELVPLYAGIAPGLIGVDQVNVQVPVGIAPSSAIALLLRQSGNDSSGVVVAIQ